MASIPPTTDSDAPPRLVEMIKQVRSRPGGVLEQGIRWRPDNWATPELLAHKRAIAELADDCDEGSRPGERIVRRRHVVDRADDEVAQFFAAMIWGFGPQGYGASRVGKIVDQAGKDFAPRLRGITAAARTGPGEAWDAITRDHKLQLLGPAFGTKVAYFAALSSPPAALPLIADLNTSWAMWGLVGLRRSVGRRDSYLAYVDLAHKWATQHGCRPDDIEWALFEIGKNVPKT